MSKMNRRMTFLELSKRGYERPAAAAAALAFFPLDTEGPASRKFAKAITKRAKQWGQEHKHLRPDEVEEAAVAVLNEYCELARVFQEPYYMTRFCQENIDPGLA